MSSNTFSATLIKNHAGTQARVLQISTPHGHITTPAFMPVGTKAAVAFMNTDDLLSTGTQIILGGNTYHMLGSPGLDAIQSLGGMHKIMNWDKPMLTDSGGFQVYSLSRKSDICKIDEQAAIFTHPVTNNVIRLTPQLAIDAQKIIGADIIMALDHCTADSHDKTVIKQAMDRTHRWLLESIEQHKKNPCSAYGFYQALFGIIQGVGFKDLREESTKFVVSQDLDGIAFGGVHTGDEMGKTVEVLKWIVSMIPTTKPRYTMGVGAHPQNLLDVIEIGIDMFDCVAPTRNARHGAVFSGKVVRKGNWLSFESEQKSGRINLKNQAYATDERPIMESCKCFTCSNYSRSHLRHLLKSKSADYCRVASIHNVQVMQDTCNAARQFIMDGTLADESNLNVMQNNSLAVSP